jgi:hypothetical protein
MRYPAICRRPKRHYRRRAGSEPINERNGRDKRLEPPKRLRAEGQSRAEEKAAFYERPCDLNGLFQKYLEWANAEKTKGIEVLETEKEELEKKYQDVLDDNIKDFEWMYLEVDKNQNGFLTCWEQHLDLLHLCNV